MNDEQTILYINGDTSAIIRTEYLNNKDNPFEGNKRLWIVIRRIYQGVDYFMFAGYFNNMSDLVNRVNIINNFEITDNISKGFWCTYCKKFSIYPTMKGKEEIKLIDGVHSSVKTHYDGCRGWD